MKEAAENSLKLAKMSGVVSCKLNLYRNKALIYHSYIIQYFMGSATLPYVFFNHSHL